LVVFEDMTNISPLREKHLLRGELSCCVEKKAIDIVDLFVSIAA
jgi:hypothetical protein